MAFHDDFAFIGVSKPRYKRFEGLLLDQKLKDVDLKPWCGVQVVDLTSGTCAGWLRIDGDLTVLYALEVIPGVVASMAVSPDSREAAQLITLAAS